MDGPGNLLDDPYIKDILANGRTVTDVLVKMLGIHAATTIAVGHLTTLKGMPEPAQARTILGFWLCPMFPLAELIIDSYRSLTTAWKTSNRGGRAYHLAACLGARAVCVDGEEENALFLLDVDPDPRLLVKHPKPRDARWLGRIAVLTAFLAQDLTVIILYVRRIKHIVDFRGTSAEQRLPGSADSEFDNVKMQFAVGGFFAGLTGLILMLCNWTWTYSPKGAKDPTITRSRAHWHDVLPLDEESPIGIELSLSLLLTVVARWPRVWFFTEVAGFPPGLPRTEPKTDNEILLLGLRWLCAVGVQEVFVVVLILANLIARTEWGESRNLSSAIVDHSILIILALIFQRLLAIVETFSDLLAVRACTKQHSACLRGFVWRDPKEGVLWAL